MPRKHQSYLSPGDSPLLPSLLSHAPFYLHLLFRLILLLSLSILKLVHPPTNEDQLEYRSQYSILSVPVGVDDSSTNRPGSSVAGHSACDGAVPGSIPRLAVSFSSYSSLTSLSYSYTSHPSGCHCKRRSAICAHTFRTIGSDRWLLRVTSLALFFSKLPFLNFEWSTQRVVRAYTYRGT